MKNEDIFISTVEESAQTQLRIDEDYKSQYSNLKKMFKLAFDSTAFKLVNDCLYYQGENLKDDEDPKIKKVLTNIGDVFTFYKMRKQDDLINSYLRTKFGIQITEVEDSVNHDTGIKKFEKFCELWEDTFHTKYNNETKEDILNKLLEQGQIVQNDICIEESKIDVEGVAIAEAECEVNKGNFKAAVNLKTIAIKKGESAAQDKVNAILEKRVEFDAAVDAIVKDE
jgi:hypothetical protein